MLRKVSRTIKIKLIGDEFERELFKFTFDGEDILPNNFKHWSRMMLKLDNHPNDHDRFVTSIVHRMSKIKTWQSAMKILTFCHACILKYRAKFTKHFVMYTVTNLSEFRSESRVLNFVARNVVPAYYNYLRKLAYSIEEFGLAFTQDTLTKNDIMKDLTLDSNLIDMMYKMCNLLNHVLKLKDALLTAVVDFPQIGVTKSVSKHLLNDCIKMNNFVAFMTETHISDIFSMKINDAERFYEIYTEIIRLSRDMKSFCRLLIHIDCSDMPEPTYFVPDPGFNTKLEKYARESFSNNNRPQSSLNFQNGHRENMNDISISSISRISHANNYDKDENLPQFDPRDPELFEAPPSRNVFDDVAVGRKELEPVPISFSARGTDKDKFLAKMSASVNSTNTNKNNNNNNNNANKISNISNGNTIMINNKPMLRLEDAEFDIVPKTTKGEASVNHTSQVAKFLTESENTFAKTPMSNTTKALGGSSSNKKEGEVLYQNGDDIALVNFVNDSSSDFNAPTPSNRSLFLAPKRFSVRDVSGLGFNGRTSHLHTQGEDSSSFTSRDYVFSNTLNLNPSPGIRDSQRLFTTIRDDNRPATSVQQMKRGVSNGSISMNNFNENGSSSKPMFVNLNFVEN